MARRYSTTSEPFEDLVQVANLGLLKAVHRFDPKRGTAFPSYAAPTILGELRRYFRDFSWSVHVTRGAQELALKVEQAQRELQHTRRHEPSVAELAEYLKLSTEEVVEALETAALHRATSLDASRDAGKEGSETLGETLGEEDEHFRLVEERMTLLSLVTALPILERRVLALRFGEEMTQSQIALKIGVSQMQVSRILRRALNRLNEVANTTVGEER